MLDCIAGIGLGRAHGLRAHEIEKGITTRDAFAMLISRSTHRYSGMRNNPIVRSSTRRSQLSYRLAFFLCILTFTAFTLRAQDDPLNKVHVPPPSSSTPATGAPAGADPAALTGPDALKAH